MGKLLGTLIVVVLKAKNLPNKQRIGKQDPYCSVALNTDRKRTQTVKKGGQTPEWDAELRFEVWQDMQDELQSEITATGGVRPAAAQDPAKQRANKANSASGKKVLNISVWADDPKDPDLVGDATVDLTEPLKLGEWDEWVPLMFKGKYAGEVFLELTFYSAAPEPKKRPVGPAAGEFEPVAFPSDPAPHSTPSPSTSSRPAKVISRPDLPVGLRPGAAASASSGSRLSVSEAASSLGVSSRTSTPSSARQQLRHSVSGDLSEFGQSKDASQRDRRASYIGPVSTAEFPPLRHPFDPDAYLEEQPSEAPLPPPLQASLSSRPSGPSIEKPLPQPKAPPAPTQMPHVASVPLTHSYSSPSMVHQSSNAASQRPLPVPAGPLPPSSQPPQPFDLRQQMHQLTLSASQPSLHPQTYNDPLYSSQSLPQQAAPPPPPPPFQPPYEHQSPSPYQPSPSPYQPSHSPIHPYSTTSHSYSTAPYATGPSPVHNQSPLSPPPPIPPRPASSAPPSAHYGNAPTWAQHMPGGYTSPPLNSMYAQPPPSHIPSYEAAYGTAFGVPSASLQTATTGVYQPVAPPRPTSYTPAPPAGQYYQTAPHQPYNMAHLAQDPGQHHGRPLPVPDPSISGGWSQQQTHEFLQQQQQHR